jgi:hypothetical protein
VTVLAGSITTRKQRRRAFEIKTVMHASTSPKVTRLRFLLTNFNDHKYQQQAERVAALQAEVDALQMNLGSDFGFWCIFNRLTSELFSENEDSEKIVSNHIKLLHQYNESKDATQVWLSSPRIGNVLTASL